MVDAEVILGNSNRRFSGVTSTMLQTLPGVSEEVKVSVLGEHHLPEGVEVIGFRDLVKLGKEDFSDGKARLFHARRNDEMIQALLAKRVFGAKKLKVVFTSTAQRYHSGLTKWLMGQMDGIITTCSAANGYLERPADVVIPHGVDLERFEVPESKDEAWKKLGFPGEYGVGIFGRVREQKGVDVLVEAVIPLLENDPKPTVVIVGETTPKFEGFQRELEEKVARAGLSERVIFHGKRPGGELKGLFQGMSVVAALSRNEGFGLTVLEAMACGAAVLASKAGAWEDIISDGEHGYVVPCGAVEETREKLKVLFSDPDELKAMGLRGRAHVEKDYSVAREARQLCAYYREVRMA